MNLSQYLDTKGIKKHKFAEQIGISKESLYLYMSGKRKAPKYIELAVKQETNNKVNQICDTVKK